jgi:NAD-specific glutamate dehydrogenase
MPQARAQSLCSSGLDKIDADILRTALSFNQHLRMTNFFKADAPSAVAYRFTGARRPLASLLQPCSLRAIA